LSWNSSRDGRSSLISGNEGAVSSNVLAVADARDSIAWAASIHGAALMSIEKRIHPLVFHPLMAIGLLFVPPFPLIPLSYVTCVSLYYIVRTFGRVLLAGPGHPWFRTTCFLLCATGLSAASSVVIMGYYPSRSTDPPFLLGLQFLFFAAVGLPLWFALLQLLRLPLAFFRWRARKREALRSARLNEEAAHRDGQRREEQRRAAAAQAADQRRRIEARASCELAYSLHASEIGKRFPKSMFDSFIQTYMSDADHPDDVERRGKELQRIIDQHRQRVKPEKQPRTIQELAEWYLREKGRIDALPLDRELKQEHAAALDMRYAELTQELLQRIEP
jgi:hypothetical protein